MVRLHGMALLGFAVSMFSRTPTRQAAAASAPAPASPPPDAPKDGPTFTPTLRITLRGEGRTEAGDGQDPRADAWRVVEGVRAGVRMAYQELTVVGQLQDVRTWGQGGPISANPFTGLHQGYIEIGGKANRLVSGFVRVGRQEIVYGSVRHLHRSPYNPASRAFDSLRARLELGRASIEAAYMLVGRPQIFTLTEDDGTQRRVRSRGDHLAYSDIGYEFHEAVELHAAVLVQQLDATAEDPDRSRFFVMPGGRVTGQLAPGLDYEAEGWLQRGDDRGRPLRAWMAVAAVGYEAPVPSRPGGRLHYEIHSGSACVGDAAQGEACGDTVRRDFDELDGARHRYRGWMDLFAGSNLRDLAASAFVWPLPTLKATAVYHFFQLQAASGRWYRLDGESVWGSGWDARNDNNTLGHEIDLLINYKPWKYLSIRPGYSVFFKGPAARRLLTPQTMHFVMLWFLAEF